MKICMVAYTFYEFDGRVKRYAEKLFDRGDRVDVVALRHDNQTKYTELNGVRLHRIQRRELDEKGKLIFIPTY